MINLVEKYVEWAFDCATFVDVDIGAAFFTNRMTAWKVHWLVILLIELKVAYIAVENIARQ